MVHDDNNLFIGSLMCQLSLLWVQYFFFEVINHHANIVIKLLYPDKYLPWPTN